MPYDIQLKSGQVLRNIPDNVDPEKVIAEASKYSATSDSDMENFLAGIGSGMVDIGRRATNLVLPEAWTPEWASDEAIEEQKRTDRELLDTKAGFAGNLVGATAATLPAGAVPGMMARGAQGANVLSKTLGAATKTLPRKAAVEGAVVGTVMADPDERLQGAAMGAGLGGAMSKGGQVLKRTFGEGIVKRTPSAIELERRGIEVPLGTGAQSKGASGMIKNIYNDIMPNIPGAGGRIIRQSEHAMDKFRDMALKQAIPEGVDVKIDPNDVQGTMRKLNEWWAKEAYSELNTIPIYTKADWMPDTAAAFLRSAPKKVKAVVNKELKRITDGEGIASFKDLQEVRISLDKLANKAERRSEQVGYRNAVKAIDELLKDQMSKGDWNYLKSLERPWAALKDLRKAASSASGKEGKFTPAELTNASSKRAGERLGSGGEGQLQELGNLGIEALGKGIEDPTFWRRIALAGLTLGSGVTAPAVGLPVYGAALAASTRKGQQFLQGITPTQRKLMEKLGQHAKPVEHAGRLARTMAVLSTRDDE